MLDVILDTFFDTLKILLFLWFAFLILELLEHKFQDKTKKVIETSGRFGPLLGGILGVFPQCGFSVMATNLYVTRIITLGTLISVYLTTSDEMLPILIAHGTSFLVILKLIGTKFLFGVISGFVIDLFVSFRRSDATYDLCQKDHCHCDKSLILSSLTHTFKILFFIAGVSFLLNTLMYYGGEDALKSLFENHSILSPFLTSLIGLIPNCAASVVLTELYLSHIISFSCVISGLLTGSGVALLVLFRTNKNIKENFKILILVYFIGAFSGVLLEILEYLF